MGFKYSLFGLLLILLSGCSTHQLKSADGTTLPVLVGAYPVDEKKIAPTVLISHGSKGVQEHYTDWAKRIRSWGYNAVIVDHYTKRGIGYHTGEFIPGARGEDRARDMAQASEWVIKQPWHHGKMAVIGFGQGGAGVLALAEEQDLLKYHKIVAAGAAIPFVAAVAFYPTCRLYNTPVRPTIPVQIFFAGNDSLSPMGYCYRYVDPLYSVRIYPEATNAFDIVAPFRGAKYQQQYRPDLAEQSQQETRKFLEKYLK